MGTKKLQNKLILKKTFQFKTIAKMGCKYHTPHFLILVHQNSLNYARLGITASRRVGNAVVRNRVKRLLREFFRHNQDRFNSYDLSIIVKKNIDKKYLNYSFIDVELEKIIYKIC